MPTIAEAVGRPALEMIDMPLLLTAEAMKAIFPNALPGVIDAFISADGQRRLAGAGITENPVRLATALAHVCHETSGYSIRNLTENTNYTAERMAAVWPKRFASASAVRAKYGTGHGWQNRAFDDIYGNRMGNRPGTSDGSAFIGRGGPQVTGRDGYREVGKRCGLPLEAHPELACRPEHQPAILAAFWSWKGLNPLADEDNVETTVRPWNGGTNGLADRRARYARILRIVSRLPSVPDLPDAPVTHPKPLDPVAVPPAPAPLEPADGASLIEAIVKIISAVIGAFKRK